MVSDAIIESVKKSQYFSVMCDETTDTSHHEQLCLCVRFVERSVDRHHTIREEFLQFQAVLDLTGEGLARTIITALESYGLDITKLVGQGYDGASAMSGCTNGIQSKVREVAPLATYVHCSSHVLNLVLNTACAVSEIRNMFGTVKEVTNFVNESAKRREILSSVQPDDSSRHLVTLCETRFVERHDALIVFAEMYEHIIHCLDAIAQQSRDRKAADKAINLSRAMADPVFIVALSCAQRVMGVTVVLSRSLQKVNQDLFEATQSVDFVKNKLKKWRESEDNEVWADADDGVFAAAESVAAAAGIGITAPRVVGRQTARSNVPASTPTDYYRRAVWYPYLDSIITAMDTKFTTHQLTTFKLVALVPSIIEKYGWKDVVDAFRFYRSSGDFDSETEVQNEFEQWKAFCLRMTSESDDRPTTPLAALDIIPSRFENIRRLLQIFCTLPVTTCTAERAFSSLKLLKTDLRNSMTDDRLTGLALMYVHPEIDIDIDTVIDHFAARPVKRPAADSTSTTKRWRLKL